MARSTVKPLLAALGVVLLVLGFAPRASDFVYWANFDGRARRRGMVSWMIRRASLMAALSAASFLLFGGEAFAGTLTVGQDFEAGNVICGSQTDLQTSVSSGNSYTVAAAGVITSWSFHNGIDALPGLKLKVARPQSGGGYVFVGEAEAGTQNLHALNTYPANIPVQPGDIIGIFVGSPFGHCGTFTSNSGDTFDQFTGNPPLNTPVSPDTSGSLVRYPVSATVTTPDAVPTPPPPSNTGQRAAAVKKCKKKFKGKAKARKRKKCVNKAKLLPL